MSATSKVLVIPALALIAIGLSGCFARKQDGLVKETFNSDNTYSRNYPVQPAQACESARRALLSQGYVVSKATADAVEGTKNFQPNDDLHEQLELRVSCVGHGQDESWVFVSALQDRYALKKSPTSASVGVGVLGSVSLPIGSSDDSMVRVASSTVQDGDFYKRFFQLMSEYLPKSKPAPPAPPAHPPAAVPAPAPTPAASAPAALAVPAPVVAPTPPPPPAATTTAPPSGEPGGAD